MCYQPKIYKPCVLYSCMYSCMCILQLSVRVSFSFHRFAMFSVYVFLYHCELPVYATSLSLSLSHTNNPPITSPHESDSSGKFEFKTRESSPHDSGKQLLLFMDTHISHPFIFKARRGRESLQPVVIGMC